MKYIFSALFLMLSLNLYSSAKPVRRLLSAIEVTELRTFQSLSEIYLSRIVAVEDTTQDAHPWVSARVIELINGTEVLCRLQLNISESITVNVNDLRKLPDIQG